jgi:CHAT domain-containing protein
LWKVSDVSTQLYMQYFYANCESLKSVTLAEASRTAKLKLLHSKEYSSPYYWSGFILIGK